VSINGRVLGHGSVGSVLRTDVALALDEPELSLSGWEVFVDLHDIPGPVAELDVSVWYDGRTSPALLPPIPITLVDGVLADKFVGHLDLPKDDEKARRDVIAVAGWAFTDQAPVGRLEILINGRSVGLARLGLQRPDLTSVYPVPHALVSGFECQVDLGAVPHDEHDAKIEVLAQTSNGSATVVFERTVSLTPPEDVGAQKRPYRLRHRRTPDYQAEAVSSSDGLNLVVFTHDLGYGGGQLWLYELLAQAGAGRAFPCTVVSPRVGPLISDLEDLGIELHISQDFPVQDLEMYEGRLAELGHWMLGRGHNAALVNTFGSFPGADLAQRLGIPVVWAIHESWTPSEIWSVAYPPGYVDEGVRSLGERALRQAKALMFEAEATRAQYLDAAAKDRAVVVPYGIDTSDIERYCETTSRDEARRRVGVPQDSRVLLVMGTTEPRKAQTLLAEAFAVIAAQYPDALLVFVGDTGSPYAEALNDYVVAAGISHQTLVLPVLKDINQWYRSADVLVCASDVESLPRSVLDAMCFGIPVLATAVFGLPELITDGATGLLYQPRDLMAATEALRRVLDLDPQELASIARAGQRLLLHGYESSGYATDTLALLLGLVEHPDAIPSEVLRANGRHSSQPAALLADRPS
jgi:D-inositol-3-phosphate glycosyltransferase